MARPHIPSEAFLVVTMRSEHPGDNGVAGEAPAADDRDARDDARQARPQREGAGVEGTDNGVVGVPRPAAAALGEDDGRQAHALDQLEQTILLSVAEHPLRAPPAPCSRRRARRRHLLRKEAPVDSSRAGEKAIGRRPLAEVL